MTLLAISGKAQVGKSTFGDFLAVAFKEQLGVKYTVTAYAAELKEKLINEFNLSHEQLYGSEKEVPDHRYLKERGRSRLELPFKNYDDGKLWEDKDLYWTARELMQFIGTDCYRKIDNDYWVKSLFKSIDKLGTKDVIINDCRFKNEIDAVSDRNGYHIKIIRNTVPGVHGQDHASETTLDTDYRVDFRIVNNGTLEELNKSAQDVASIIINLKNNSNKGGIHEYNY